MYSLEVIKKLNRPANIRRAQRRARALNNPGGHAKDQEKGRAAAFSHKINAFSASNFIDGDWG